MAADLPDRARIVIIGGGVAGASTAYHLARAGERDVLLVERSELTSGSTFHSAGMVGQLRSDPTLTAMNAYSVQLYRELEAGANPVGWRETGSIRLASSPERMQELRRQLSWAQVAGLPMAEIGPDDAHRLSPPLDPTGVVGGVYLPTDGYLDPSQLCYSLAAAARAAGVRVAQRTRVTALTVREGRIRAVVTDAGTVDCEAVVIAGGMFAAEIGRMAGVRIPLIPMSHQYLVTEGIAGIPAGLPSIRDPDLLVYVRPEGAGLLMGGYERHARPFTAGPNTLDAVPADFNGRLLDPDWDAFAEIAENAGRRFPVLATAGVRRLINGPEAFTPDNEFCLGQTAVDGLFVAAGFCAHGIAGAGGVGRVMAEWVLAGQAPDDLWHMDVSRFGAQYRSPAHTLARTLENYQTYYDIRYPGDERSATRPLRRSPAYAWHQAHGAAFGEKGGWERVNYYRSNESRVSGISRPRGWAGQNFSPAVAAEHLACRESAALFDESSFAKLRISGSDALAFLNHSCDNEIDREVGTIVYTQMLNDRGGIEADVTITRVESDAFWMISGTAFGAHDRAWLDRAARSFGRDVRIDDITGQYCCFALWGPRAAEILATVSPDDLGLPFLTSREITVGDVPVRALNSTYVGEPGFELYASAEYGATLWKTVWAAGRSVDLVAGGYRAIESLRLEKGYRAWSTDLTAVTTPLEAGLGFCVAWDKPGGFVGREALRAVRETGPVRRLRALLLDDPVAVALGGEPVLLDGVVAGRVTSAGFGYSLGASIAYTYLPREVIPGTAVQLDLFGERLTGTVRAGAPMR